MSNPHLNTAIGAVAFAPFGESYNKSSAMRLNFTDQFQDSQIPDTYDFEARKLSDIQGRWLSPDPAGLAAVDLTNPQTWNRYAYVGNKPMTATDPLGLFIAVCRPARGGDLVCFDGGGDGTGGIGFDNPVLVGGVPPCYMCGGPGGGGGGYGGQPGPGGPSGGPSGPSPIGVIPGGGILGCGGDFLPCGLSPTSHGNVPCDFGICGPSIGNDFGPGEAAAGAATLEGICIIVEPCGVSELLVGGALFLGTVAAIDTYHHFSNNVAQNRQFDEAVRQIESRCGRKLGKADRRRLHDEITGGGFSLPDIVEIGVGMFCPGN